MFQLVYLNIRLFDFRFKFVGSFLYKFHLHQCFTLTRYLLKSVHDLNYDVQFWQLNVSFLRSYLSQMIANNPYWNILQSTHNERLVWIVNGISLPLSPHIELIWALYVSPERVWSYLNCISNAWQRCIASIFHSNYSYQYCVYDHGVTLAMFIERFWVWAIERLTLYTSPEESSTWSIHFM